VNLVARFESFIERLMERTFTRAARSHLQPVEISKRLVRAMEAHQSVGVSGMMVPNIYDVYLSEYDYPHFEPMKRSLARNFEGHLGRVARQRRFELVSQPVVTLNLGRDVAAGNVRVETQLMDIDRSGEERQHTAVLPQVEPTATARSSTPSLLFESQTYAVLRSPSRVGRLADNDIVLDDKRVSRHHAELSTDGSRWLLKDIGSTNGTAVNGKIVREIVLKPGDTISLGGLEVTWEQ
jgi:Protein of unknown function (DUF3662)/FHA domain